MASHSRQLGQEPPRLWIDHETMNPDDFSTVSWLGPTRPDGSFLTYNYRILDLVIDVAGKDVAFH
jgi:hypothetical protein